MGILRPRVGKVHPQHHTEMSQNRTVCICSNLVTPLRAAMSMRISDTDGAH